MKKVYLFFILIFLFQNNYALSISEIDFGSVEFVELLKNSTDEFNESYFYVFDQSTGKNNSFSLIQEKNDSDLILIVGSKFIDENNISNLNCSIYQTSGSQVGHGGMSSLTESFQIQFNNNLFSNFTKIQSESFEINETYHFNFSSNSFKILNKSVCQISTFNLSENNSPEEIQTPQISNGNCNLEIISNQIIESEKITFSHEGNYSLGVEYYIEDGLGNIVRSKTSSSTDSTKSYTPKKNGKFIIKSQITSNGCNVNDSTEVYFYNEELDEDNDEASININEKSEIEINQVVMSGLDLVNIYFTASRGDSSKYRLKILVDDEEYAEFDFKKYSDVEFMLPIKLKPGKHDIEIEGFGLDEKIEVEMPDIISEIRDELIILTQEKGIDFTTETEFKISTDDVDELINSRIDNALVDLPKIEKVEINSPLENTSSGKEIFSKHFFSQNIGVLIICFAIIVLAGVIIALR